MEELEQESLFGLELNNEAIDQLRETAKWANLLAILGFIFCSIILLIGIFASLVILTTVPFSQSFWVLAYFMVVAIYFIPFYNLYQFTQKLKRALRLEDSVLLADSFHHLKTTFKFIGILAIITLCLYGLAFVLGGIASTLFGLMQ